MSSTIQSLPVELLQCIFDQLSPRDCERATLVCHQWCQVLRSDHYIRRMSLTVTNRNLCSRQILRRMKRPFRKLNIEDGCVSEGERGVFLARVRKLLASKQIRRNVCEVRFEVSQRALNAVFGHQMAVLRFSRLVSIVYTPGSRLLVHEDIPPAIKVKVPSLTVLKIDVFTNAAVELVRMASRALESLSMRFLDKAMLLDQPPPPRQASYEDRLKFRASDTNSTRSRGGGGGGARVAVAITAAYVQEEEEAVTEDQRKNQRQEGGSCSAAMHHGSSSVSEWHKVKDVGTTFEVLGFCYRAEATGVHRRRSPRTAKWGGGREEEARSPEIRATREARSQKELGLMGRGSDEVLEVRGLGWASSTTSRRDLVFAPRHDRQQYIGMCPHLRRRTTTMWSSELSQS
ncbi:conserved hypothetical protein [Culex quinquefasciatus]|uniref:F-box domain-containing protein n=1 Tax=Culex quinquefasciatus TaxID=7176 RepID=B0W286_CULQU|nr:conserved hypothetical protein [Culex quinquefasciatus]|eukprot:XP_001842785.1 conserved hypothetical protein [Culex quinquefasciatus]